MALLEAKIRPDQEPKDAILQGIELDPSLKEHLVFNPEIGGLVIPKPEDSIQLLVFRAHAPYMQDGEITEKDTLGGIEGKRNNYGDGLYTGNSREAVGLFSYKGQREIGIYLTQSFKPSDIFDARIDTTPGKRLRTEVARQALAAATPGGRDKLKDYYDNRYGSASLVVLDKAVGTVIAQNMHVLQNSYSVKPTWYLLRGEHALTRVGTAPNIQPRPYIQRIHRSKHAQGSDLS